jgi:hypothetical protein
MGRLEGDAAADRFEDGTIEGPALLEIPDPQMQVIDQPSAMMLHV